MPMKALLFILPFGLLVGWWYSGSVSNSEAGYIYCVSGSDTLYRIAMDGSTLDQMGVLSDDIQAMDMGAFGAVGAVC